LDFGVGLRRGGRRDSILYHLNCGFSSFNFLFASGKKLRVNQELLQDT
jgi:hypothetical protein